MARKTVTRADLSSVVEHRVGLSHVESAKLVDQVLKEIMDCLERGDEVLLSSFGKFVVRDKGERAGRNPRTGAEHKIAPRRVLVFRSSPIVRQQINSKPTSSPRDADRLPSATRDHVPE